MQAMVLASHPGAQAHCALGMKNYRTFHWNNHAIVLQWRQSSDKQYNSVAICVGENL